MSRGDCPIRPTLVFPLLQIGCTKQGHKDCPADGEEASVKIGVEDIAFGGPIIGQLEPKVETNSMTPPRELTPK